jgi:hypothetical protein
VSGPSDGCGFSGIRLRMSDLEAAISDLDANKGPIFNLSLSTGTGTFPSKNYHLPNVSSICLIRNSSRIHGKTFFWPGGFTFLEKSIGRLGFSKCSSIFLPVSSQIPLN